ncbi:EamA family transporter [Fischerella thermalis WC542]|uniref:DMT family transporter n=1 Tax=Fischerella thermalis TaxID=372787 RepID=UPI000C7FD058|nr:DMT family transporter [Fischerella thermalis]PLZ27037.1 EamA family transporter [Fischerella thermalis WC559]PLZ34269.1 EamA family transporter [Fischerella thermalis WC542]
MTKIHQTSGRWRLGLALSLLTAFLWGILPIALSVTLQKLDVYTVTWFRFLIAFVLLAIYLGVRGKLPTLRQLRSTSGKLLAIATIFLALNYILFLQGLALTSPYNAELLIQLAPLLMGLGGLVIFRERYTLTQWLALGILTIGFILFFHEQLLQSFIASSQSTNTSHTYQLFLNKNIIFDSSRKYLLGSSLIILAAVTWAVYALAQKQLLKSLSSSNIMLMIYGGCTLFFSVFAKPKTIFNLDYFHAATLLFCALNTLIAYGAFSEALEHWEASRVSAVLASTPIITLLSVEFVSVIAPNLIAPEKLTLVGMLGAVLVITSSVAIALGER